MFPQSLQPLFTILYSFPSNVPVLTPADIERAQVLLDAARPRLSGRQDVFQDLEHGGVNQPLWVPSLLLSLSLPFPLPPLPLYASFPTSPSLRSRAPLI